MIVEDADERCSDPQLDDRPVRMHEKDRLVRGRGVGQIAARRIEHAEKNACERLGVLEGVVFDIEAVERTEYLFGCQPLRRVCAQTEFNERGMNRRTAPLPAISATENATKSLSK